ncbi:MAG TPA: MBL fold metallo-hydrolase [Herpetosiphonaceae bacterium]|nr:MBL fold metallo-hydrolase [Herpetosiphonaceae bacterium]
MMQATTPEIVTLRLPLVNAYLVRSRRWVLINAGAPGDEQRILRAAARSGVRPRDIALIVLTHGHVDHFGSAAALRQLTGHPSRYTRRTRITCAVVATPRCAAPGWKG